MNLYIMRHGQAAAPSADQEQILTKEGQMGIEELAIKLGQQGIKLAHIFHSGKARARQTAEIMATMIGTNIDLKVHADIKPDNDPQQLINDISDWHEDTLVVSHLPFIPHLITLLTADNQGAHSITFQPGTIVCLTPNNSAWNIEWVTMP